jgi:HD-GYP domain-containing protein (c-di-GMP phosphodiesterase class II)
MIARALNLPPEDIRELSFAGRVHDLGKMFVPERVLNKQGSLTEEEFELLKNHPLFAGEVLATMPGAERIKKAAECHHEHLDGTGYPGELKGDAVPLWGRIIAVANTYVNLTSDRTLTPAKTSEQAITELERGSGTKYDGMLVRILARELKSERSFPNIG